ncbi:MAG: hypothetical protein ACM3TT_14475 [Syntrophothermus sp.]
MKQVLFNQKGQGVVEEVPEPLLGDNGVLVCVAVSLLSGIASDLLNRFLDFDQGTGILVHVRKD